MHHSLIRGCRPNSFFHPIHACAHSRLDQCGFGSGVGVGFGACEGASCVVSSGVVDDVDDACMDGSKVYLFQLRWTLFSGLAWCFVHMGTASFAGLPT